MIISVSCATYIMRSDTNACGWTRNYNNFIFRHFISEHSTMRVEPMSKSGFLDLGFIIGFIVDSCRFRPKFHSLFINSEFYRCNKISSLQWSCELVSLWPKKSSIDFNSHLTRVYPPPYELVLYNQGVEFWRNGTW